MVYDFRELDELVLSYAITIHKSQGGEYPCVLIPRHTALRVITTQSDLCRHHARQEVCDYSGREKGVESGDYTIGVARANHNASGAD